MVVALAAGALVLASVACVVAVVAARAVAHRTVSSRDLMHRSVAADAPPPAALAPPDPDPGPPAAAPGPAVHPESDRSSARLDAAEQRAGRAELLLGVADAFSRSNDPTALHEVAGRALAALLPARWSELLLVGTPDHGTPAAGAPLRPVARSSGPAGQLAACPVTELTECPAARRAQPLLFPSSDGVDACVHLAGRPTGVCSALCTPVAVDTRVVGVVHVLGPAGVPVDGGDVSDVIWLAGHLGARLEEVGSTARRPERPPGDSSAASADPQSVTGRDSVGGLPSTAAEREPGAAPLDLTDRALGTEPQVDSLTGLPGRAVFLQRLRDMQVAGTGFVVVVADVDDLSGLNRRAGHGVGDDAVATLGSVLSSGLGPGCVAARIEGATFAIACPDLTLGRSVEAIEVVRSELLDAVVDGAAPSFTCSFGLTHSSISADAEELLRVARSGLHRAQELGGDQIVYADLTLADSADEAPPAD